MFDACGDQLGGKVFRQALNAKLALCHVPGDAMARYRLRTTLLMKRERERMDKIVEERGGLPMSLEGMAGTCHAQQSSPAYHDLMTRLDAYGQGKATPESVITGACDAQELAP